MHKKPHDHRYVALKPDRETVCRLTGKTGAELPGIKYGGGLPRTRCHAPPGRLPDGTRALYRNARTAETGVDIPGRTCLVSCTPLFDAEETFTVFPWGNER
ncbi:MAG: hypothetical protein NTW33_12930 [Methanoregula sp.]|nr:hypothetical protein [Methanoregula sp.]